ncbi:hypothetical protein [Allosalinactinospora lopnorensis]|uniref:hypothetical protein n=1 Tax=Allosalinactinospora lopnorensis TaxID=1352348 RepID=UPI003084440E
MTTDTAQRATGRAWLGLAVLTLPLIMAATDMTVLFLAPPTSLRAARNCCGFCMPGSSLPWGSR